MRSKRSIPWSFGLIAVPLIGGLLASRVGLALPPEIGHSPPVELTSEQDHQRILDLLHISSLRNAPDANPASPNAANFDESKANPYPELPSALALKNGRKVTTAKMWWSKRRPEIVEDFDREVYGRAPKDTPKVNWEVASSIQETSGDTPVITRKLVGHVDNSAYPSIAVDIQATLTTPAVSAGPVPVIMTFGFDPAVMLRLRAQLEARGQKIPPAPPGPTWQEQVVAKGWGYAVIIPTSFQADSGAGLTHGIIGLCNKGQPRKLDDWGTLRAWAWGASRFLDYLETDKEVDAKRVGIEGLSRYGKAALVTMAYDQRFAIALVGSSGAGGAKILRRNFGETVENLAATGEYHWMAGNFLKYAGPLNPKDLPVDAHELIALAAPRPVFISCGSPQVEGGWVDDRGQFMAEVAAGPVYKLLGKRGLGAATMPPIGTPLIKGDLAFRQHEGGHTDGPNWPSFLEFAARYMGKPHLVSQE
ncbi:MAG: acetylxylan esterase [Acidobacteriia bacterium]|nr:acetylxylan esterase [Terriglobia bacterium]